MFRPYWSRAWIIPEVVLVRQATMIGGMSLFQFQDLVTVRTWVMRLHVHWRPSFVDNGIWLCLTTPRVQELSEWKMFMRYGMLRHSVQELVTRGQPKAADAWKDLLITTRAAKASDPRDKLYGIRGILPHGATPDYSISVEQVYCKFTSMCLDADGKLRILLFVGHGLLRIKTGRPVHHLFLPLWVPNWHLLTNAGLWVPIPATMANFDANKYALEQDIPPFSCHGNILEAPGIHLSEVSTHSHIGQETKSIRCFWLDYIGAHKNQRDASGSRVLLTVIRLLLLDRLPDSDMQLGLSPKASELERAIVFVVALLFAGTKERIEFLEEGRITQYIDQPVDGIRLKWLVNYSDVRGWDITKSAQRYALICALHRCYELLRLTKGILGGALLGYPKGMSSPSFSAARYLLF